MQTCSALSPPFLRPPPLAVAEVSLLLMARSRPLPRHQLTREQLRAAEELVRRGYFSKTAEERKRRDRVFRLTRQGHSWLVDHGLDHKAPPQTELLGAA